MIKDEEFQRISAHMKQRYGIDLSQKKDGPVYLRIAGRKWFDGMMGVSEKHIAVKIRRVYHNVERRDSQVNEQ